MAYPYTSVFNQYGNLEFDSNQAVYSISTDKLGSDDVVTIERSIKRKKQDHEIENLLLVPNSVEIKGRYTQFEFDLSYLLSFDRLKEWDLEKKLPYFLSLIKIGEAVENGTLNIIWDRNNFIVDPHEHNIKVMLYETSVTPLFIETKSVVHQVKELIITSITNLKQVDSLPKYNDLLMRDSMNKDFCQELYKQMDLQDIRYLIQKTELRYEQSHLEDDNLDDEESEVVENKGLFKKKNQKKNKKNVKAVQVNNSNQKRKSKKNNGPFSKFDRTTKIVLGLVVVLFLFFGGSTLAINILSGKKNVDMSTSSSLQSNNDTASTYFKSSDNDAVRNTLIRAYRAAYNGKTTEAYTILESLNLRDIDISDLSMIISIYDSQNALSSLLDSYPVPELTNEVITHLIKEDKIENLSDISQDMNTQNPYIDFEVAFLEGEFEKVIELKEQVTLNGRKEGQIVEAYLALDKKEEALSFAQKVGNPDLIKTIEGYNTF